MARLRLEPEQVEAFAARLNELAEELGAVDSPHGRVYGLVVGLYASKLPTLPGPEESQGP